MMLQRFSLSFSKMLEIFNLFSGTFIWLIISEIDCREFANCISLVALWTFHSQIFAQESKLN